MPPIRNSSVARGVVPTGTAATVYTVPAANVLLLKDVRIASGVVAGTTWSLTLYDPTGPTTVYVVNARALTSLADSWSGWIALNAGQQLEVACSGNAVAYWISGAVLPFVPGF